MPLVLVMLPALRLAVLRMRCMALAMLRVILGRLSRRGLRDGGRCDDKRHRSDKHMYLHVVLRR